MKKKKLNPSLKIALASTIAVTSAATIVYNTPEIVKTVAVESNEDDKFILDVEKIDNDTIKVSLDNIEDIPKAIQFSIKLDGVVPKKSQDGKIIIENLIGIDDSDETRAVESDTLITDYTYNETENTIDVLITSQEPLDKEENKIEVFKLDIEKSSNNESRKYSISNKEGSEYKYVSDTNKEYSKAVKVLNEELSINTAPTINKKENVDYIEINVGEELSLTRENLEKYIVANDTDEADMDSITFEVKDIDGNIKKEFSITIAGIYDLYVTAKDSFGGESETLKLQVKVNELDIAPIITRNKEELKDITINAGEIFNLMEGIEAVDALGNKVNVTVKSNIEVNLDTEVDTKYEITYTAIDNINRKTEKTIILTVKGNKAPIITGVKDYIEEDALVVGDTFDPYAGVEVEDEDQDIKLNVSSNVNTSIPGIYKVIYSATDKGNKTTRVQSTVVVNPKSESINAIPKITANDVIIQLNDEFNELSGVTAYDEEDKDITENIRVIKNEVNTKVAGKYNVVYGVTDSKGASAVKTITVIVNDPPQINAEDKVIRLNEEFNPLSGVSAFDKEDGTINKIDIIENDVKIDEEGTYTVTYRVEDKFGGITTKTIKVTVKKYFVVADSIVINNNINSLYVGSSKILTATVDENAELKDIEWSTSNENIASIEVIGNNVKITAKAKGQVTITAKTKDGSDKSDSVTIDILEYKENIEDFILNAIEDAVDTGIIIPILGEGTKESPLEMEVQDVTIEKFEEFLNSFKEINPVIIDKYVEGEFTVYKIKIENKSIISKFIRLFKSSTTEEGYIYLKIANNLEASKDIVNKIDATIKVEKPNEDSGAGNPGGGTEGGSGTTNPGGSTEGETVTITPDKEDAEEENIDNTKQENSKLPITGQESMLGVLGLLAVSIGGIIYKKKK